MWCGPSPVANEIPEGSVAEPLGGRPPKNEFYRGTDSAWLPSSSSQASQKDANPNLVRVKDHDEENTKRQKRNDPENNPPASDPSFSAETQTFEPEEAQSDEILHCSGRKTSQAVADPKHDSPKIDTEGAKRQKIGNMVCCYESCEFAMLEFTLDQRCPKCAHYFHHLCGIDIEERRSSAVCVHCAPTIVQADGGKQV